MDPVIMVLSRELVRYVGACAGWNTECVLGKYALTAERFGVHFNAVLFRRELLKLGDIIDDGSKESAPIFPTLPPCQRSDA
jgi:hypothetical protein